MIRLSLKHDRVDRLLRDAPGRLRSAINEGLLWAGISITARAQENLVNPKYGRFRITATGALSASMAFKVDESIPELRVGPLGSAKARHYGWFVEHGRKAGRAPPASALELWVKVKLGVRGQRNIQRAAWAVAQKQKTKALPAKPFLGDAVKDFFPKKIVRRMNFLLAEEIRKLDGGSR